MLQDDVQPRTTSQHLQSQPTRLLPHRAAGRSLTRSQLPGPVRASARLPRAEFAVFVIVVPLLSIPVLLATMGAVWAAGVTLALTAVVGWLCAARRVVIGNGWLADRRLWHYRVTYAAQLRAVDLLDTGHGGVLRLTPQDGRAHRLRRPEFDRPEARAALSSLVTTGNPTVGAGVNTALGLPPMTGPAVVNAAA